MCCIHVIDGVGVRPFDQLQSLADDAQQQLYKYENEDDNAYDVVPLLVKNILCAGDAVAHEDGNRGYYRRQAHREPDGRVDVGGEGLELVDDEEDGEVDDHRPHIGEHIHVRYLKIWVWLFVISVTPD